MNKMIITNEQLKQKQSLSLEHKIILSKQKIRDWYDYFDGEVYVAFSGGKDSTVLLHLVRQLYPKVPAVFVDTGLEYPEIREFVKKIDNVVWLKPEISFKEVLELYGYPIVSKQIAMKIRKVRGLPKDSDTYILYTTGIKSDGTKSKMGEIPKNGNI